jgi:hypothetical protein
MQCQPPDPAFTTALEEQQVINLLWIECLCPSQSHMLKPNMQVLQNEAFDMRPRQPLLY